MTVTELRERMPASELRDWEMLAERETWGRRREDIRAATVAVTVARAMGGKRASRLRAEDFMPPRWEKSRAQEPRPRSNDELAQMAKSVTRRLGGTVRGD